jgi:8-oxo-dGTP diphosphatase
MADFNKVGLLNINNNRVLLCKKRKLESKLILPGGRIEHGESDLDCLRREISEELGDVQLENIEYIDTYSDIAASDDPSIVKTVEIKLYKGDIIGEPIASSEISELIWFGTDSDIELLSPILVNKIYPGIIKRGLITWNNFPRK